jgi:ketosteroid isomerase-like protein
VSQENMEVVRAAIGAFVRRDYEGVLSLCDEDIEITQAVGFAGIPDMLHGHAGVLEAFDLWAEQWDDYQTEILRVADLGDYVMVAQMVRGRGKGSGVRVEMPLPLLFSVRTGKISEWHMFASEEEALKAVGIED